MNNNYAQLNPAVSGIFKQASLPGQQQSFASASASDMIRPAYSASSNPVSDMIKPAPIQVTQVDKRDSRPTVGVENVDIGCAPQQQYQ